MNLVELRLKRNENKLKVNFDMKILEKEGQICNRIVYEGNRALNLSFTPGMMIADCLACCECCFVASAPVCLFLQKSSFFSDALYGVCWVASAQLAGPDPVAGLAPRVATSRKHVRKLLINISNSP
jgi:hypothetical protein